MKRKTIRRWLEQHEKMWKEATEQFPRTEQYWGAYKAIAELLEELKEEHPKCHWQLTVITLDCPEHH